MTTNIQKKSYIYCWIRETSFFSFTNKVNYRYMDIHKSLLETTL